MAWQSGDDIDSNSASEADSLINIYWQADVLPPAADANIHGLVRSYASEVIDHERAALAANRADPAASQILTTLRRAVTALPTTTDSVKTARDLALQDLKQVNYYHLKRVDAATSDAADHDPFTNALLVATVAGSVLMVVFPLLIGVTARGRHLAVMGLLALVLGAIMFLAVELANPLRGIFAHDPRAFETVLQQFSADP